MCGLAGFVDLTARASSYDFAATAVAMGNAVGHRGPDDQGVWVDRDAGVSLSHRRLSIIDLTSAGHQPMVSACGRYVLIYNGEVYSHEDMRPDLAGRGIKFRGHSDTEVILESCAAHGVERTVERLIGMFAFALWDRQSRTLTLVRDRLGIKPMYWGHFGGLFLFGSELKALSAHPGLTPEIDRGAVSSFLRHGYVPSPASIYRGIRKLEPGAILTLTADDLRVTRYWDAREVVMDAARDPLRAPEAENIETLHTLLKDAVGRRMIADVPVGAFLSGGIDSSLVVALMQTQSRQPVRTFTIGFTEAGFDEAPQARAVARHLGTEHTEAYVEPAQARDVIPRLPEWYDEPFADPSQIPTFLVSEMTRRHVTVSLSGDGGDELFAGYNRYGFVDTMWRRMQRVPAPLRRLAASGIGALSAATWDRLLAAGGLSQTLTGDRVLKGAAALHANSGDTLYRMLVSHWQTPDSVVRGGHESHGVLWDDTLRDAIPDFTTRIQYLDLVTYLPDDILTKLDRASMAVALEARVPLLDHRVVTLAFRWPRHLKGQGEDGKRPLRNILYRYVPRHLVDRPKMGFGVPMDIWLRGPLRDWAEDLLDARRLADGGLLDPVPVRRMWAEHLAGHNRQFPLWNVLMLEAWRRHQTSRSAATQTSAPPGSKMSDVATQVTVN